MIKHFLSICLVITQSAALAQLPKLVIPRGHTNPVTGLAIDPAGNFIYSIDGSPAVTVWDAEKYTVLSFLDGHSAPITSIALSEDGKYLASADTEGKVVIRDQAAWSIHRIISAEAPVAGILFRGNTELGILTVNGKFSVASVTSDRILRTIESAAAGISSFSWNARGELALGLANGQLELYETLESAASLAATAGEKPISSLTAGSRDGSWVAGTTDGELIWIENGQSVRRVKTPLPRLMSIHLLGSTLVVTGRGSDSNIHFYSISDGAEQSSLIRFGPDESSQKNFALGLQTLAIAPDKSFFLLPGYGGEIRKYTAQGNSAGNFSGSASRVLSLAVNRESSQLAIGNDLGVMLIDLTGKRNVQQLRSAALPVLGLRYGQNPDLLAGIQENSRLLAWDTRYDVVTFDQHTGEAPVFPELTITADDALLLKKVENGAGIFFTKSGKKPRVIKLKESFDHRFTPDGKLLLAQDGRSGINIYETEKFRKQRSIKIDGFYIFEISTDGKWVAAYRRNDKPEIQLLEFSTGRVAKTIAVPAGVSITKLFFDPSGDYVVSLSNVVTKGSSQGDFSIRFWDLAQGKEAFALGGHSAAISSLAFAQHGKVLFSGSFDGQIKIWSLENRRELASLIPLGETGWAVVTPEGLYDASPGAMENLHYMAGKEPVALEQMKEYFYEPYLLPKLLGFHQDPVRQAPVLDGFDLYPEVRLSHPDHNAGHLGISLNDQGGGIGRIVIWINGKEVINESRGAGQIADGFTSFNYSIENHPFLKPGDLNKITVRAYNREGYLSSPEKSVYLIGDKQTQAAPPRLFGLVAGVSDYQGSGIDLRYASKDAQDFYNALKISAEARFGAEHVNLQLLTTTPGQPVPTKENLLKAAEKIKQDAGPNDYLLIYLSGHGLTTKGERADFYYLTADASELTNELAEGSPYALSGSELTQLVREIPATRQVLVIDACHSGQLAESLAGSSFTMSSEQVRALETIKDRTGLYIIAGSAADAVSYEAQAFGQGLLTYSLLYGMKGPALREDRYIDIINLLNFAAQKVPELASEIGGVQKPEVRIPGDLSSFDIGELTPEQRQQIVLKANRPVLAASSFQNENTFADDLQLGELVDQQLKRLGSAEGPGVIFADLRSFPEAYVVRGRYTAADSGISVNGALFKGNRKVADINFDASERDELARLVAGAVAAQVR